MKKLIVLGTALALMVGGAASAAKFNYDVTGWQTTCSTSWFQGVEGDCLNSGKVPFTLSTGVITGAAQFDDLTGTLTVESSIDIDGGVAGLATMTITGQYFVLQNYGHPSGSNVMSGSGGNQVCSDSTGSPGTGLVCTTANTPLPLYYIDMGTPGTSTVVYMISALAGENRAWQEYTLTNVIPEPGTALLLGVGLMGLALAGRRS